MAKKIKLWDNPQQSNQLYPQTTSGAVVHGDSTLDKVVDGKADVVDIRPLEKEGSIITGKDLYVYEDYPVESRLIIATDPTYELGYYLVFVIGRQQKYAYPTYKVFKKSDTVEGYEYKCEYSYSDAPEYITNAFKENDATTDYHGLMSKEDKAKVDTIEGISTKVGDFTESTHAAVAPSVETLESNVVSMGKEIENRVSSDGALPTTFTLEGSSSTEIDLTNSSDAAKQYIRAMGGYMLYIDPSDNTKVYAAKLGADWSTFADGTAVTTAIEAATETMIHVPKAYYMGDSKTCKFYGLQGPSTAHSYDGPNWVGAYIGSGSSAGLHSRPNTTPAHSQTMSTFQTWAQKLGTQWGQWQYETWKLINMLYQARYGNLNSQATIGAGWQSSDWEACRNVAMGLTKSLGDGSGKVLYNDSTLGDQYPVKLFGFEDLWGKLWQFTPGIRYYMDGSTRHAVIYSGNQVSNTATGRDVSPVLSSASGTYANTMQLGEYWDMICQAAGGSDTTYYCDGYWAATGGELLFVGGPATDRSQCGLAYSSSNHDFSYSWSSFGSRLAFYGEPTIVSGSELVSMVGGA